MHDALIKAREARLRLDRDERERAESEIRRKLEVAEVARLMAEAARDAFAGVAITGGRKSFGAFGAGCAPAGRIEVSASDSAVWLHVAGKTVHRIEVVRASSDGRIRLEVDALGAYVRDSVPACLDALAELIAPELDLEAAASDRAVLLSAAERESLRKLIRAWPPIGVDRESLLQRLEG